MSHVCIPRGRQSGVCYYIHTPSGGYACIGPLPHNADGLLVDDIARVVELAWQHLAVAATAGMELRADRCGSHPQLYHTSSWMGRDWVSVGKTSAPCLASAMILPRTLLDMDLAALARWLNVLGPARLRVGHRIARRRSART